MGYYSKAFCTQGYTDLFRYVNNLNVLYIFVKDEETLRTQLLCYKVGINCFRPGMIACVCYCVFSLFSTNNVTLRGQKARML